MEAFVTSAPLEKRRTGAISLLFYPTGVYRIWKNKYPLWLRLAYTLVGLPVFLLVSAFLAVVTFALFLPELDMSIGDRKDRTVVNQKDHYASTFLKTSHDTKGAYELVRVEVQPQGGNGWHYHKTFDEQFTVLEGEMTIGLEGNEIKLQKGQSAWAYRTQVHFFKNRTSTKAVLLVKTAPSGGLEKSVRIGYGLGNDGQFEGELPKNPWHMPLLLAYSQTYFADIPSFIQEPLVNSLAKIAQWKGEDKALEKYFR
ncbi:hypothetical protein GCM10023189_35920 [Nibrella saemangeumensis]|uniref:Cupin type-2 domain-containing protein n=1 Tax=Nibrella saemangeumensis TaxID=1084526 RepID=A0ABP8N696_9BACT